MAHASTRSCGPPQHEAAAGTRTPQDARQHAGACWRRAWLNLRPVARTAGPFPRDRHRAKRVGLSFGLPVSGQETGGPMRGSLGLLRDAVGWLLAVAPPRCRRRSLTAPACDTRTPNWHQGRRSQLGPLRKNGHDAFHHRLRTRSGCSHAKASPATRFQPRTWTS